jgi:hypothetical protein
MSARGSFTILLIISMAPCVIRVRKTYACKTQATLVAVEDVEFYASSIPLKAMEANATSGRGH